MASCEFNVYRNCPATGGKSKDACLMCALGRIIDLLERIEGGMRDVHAALENKG